MAISQQTFPGVYASLKDESFVTTTTSRFRCGLVGVAARGPFNAIVQARSLREWSRLLGPSIPGTFMANAAAVLAEFTDGIFAVRVGHQYTQVATDGVGGGSGDAAYQITTSKAKLF